MTFKPITTKLHVPTPRDTLVKRPRLMRRLHRGVKTKLCLISAPAGFGKTTLLAEWSRRSRWPVAWVSLDAMDNDELRFWSYVAAALEKLEPRVGTHELSLLHAPQPPDMPFLLATLINLVAEIETDFVLALDDYHVITSDAVHEAVAYLIDYLPPNMHLVIASRVDPPLPVARWHARGEVSRLEGNDLRFSAEETEALMAQVLSADAPHDIAPILQERTAGWVAGLHLALLTANHRADWEALSTLSQAPYVADYLVTEVLAQQPDTVQTFLLQTAILDVLASDVCNAVTQRSDSHTLLNTLYSRGLFVSAVNQRGVYRYHPLFADFLRDQLAQHPNYDPTALHRRAARWYEQQGNVGQAIHHALAAGDAETATRLVTAAARDYVLRGEFATLRRWFTRLPEANIRAHPKLSLFYAWVLVNTGLVSHADDYLEALEANDDLDPALRGEMAVVRARAAVLRGDTEANLHFSKQALTLLPNDATLLRGDVALGLAFAHSDRQDFETARSYFEEAVARAREISHLRTLMLALYYLANTHLLQAQFSAAAQTYQRGLRACAQHDPSSALACWAYAGLGALAYEWNDSSQAEEQLQTALKLAQRCGEVKVLIYARKSLAFVRQTQGRHEDALALLHKAGEIAVQANIPSLVSEANVAKMICWAREGDLEAATSWAQQHGISLERAETDDDALTMLVWLRTAEARSLPETQRQRLLEPLVSLLLSRSDRLHTRDLIWPATQDVLSLAVIYQLLGDETRARSQLQTAVTLAAPSAPIRSFVDRGPSLASLLRELSESPRDVYVTRLLTAIEEEGSRPERSSPAEATLAEQPAQSMIEPLREREIDVLHHVAKGRTNKQIADEMVLAVSTVKWYLRNIYGKLQVHRRTQAVARARELNLL